MAPTTEVQGDEELLDRRVWAMRAILEGYLLRTARRLKVLPKGVGVEELRLQAEAHQPVGALNGAADDQLLAQLDKLALQHRAAGRPSDMVVLRLQRVAVSLVALEGLWASRAASGTTRAEIERALDAVAARIERAQGSLDGIDVARIATSKRGADGKRAQGKRALERIGLAAQQFRGGKVSKEQAAFLISEQVGMN